MEKQLKNEINFLDIKIKRDDLNSTFITSTYRKPTFTGVMLNWNSLTSIRYKTGLIKCLLDRSNKICSKDEQKVVEMQQLRDLLLKTNYPNKIIEKEFEKFIKYKGLNVENIVDPELKIKYLSLPYINDKSETIARKLQNLVKDFFPRVKLRV